ncbi:hypothetical protein CNN82_30200 [Pseudomonas frederiksbergensis]|uniref:Uncharacterized protein n=2 Tax=Pseudomonas frederiksbergensis TaxID=104087 RepID=A0AB33ELQ4_9PSED|nr:hypothetical protein CNN82_30200 [Pseudomonas frederiksbergensis]
MFRAIKKRLYRWIDSLLPARGLRVVEGDVLPKQMPFRELVLVRDGSEDWCVGFKCPCGCGRTIELLLPRDVKPRWTCSIDPLGRPTLHPSVWLKSGCESHFWVRGGRIIWV